MIRLNMAILLCYTESAHKYCVLEYMYLLQPVSCIQVIILPYHIYFLYSVSFFFGGGRGEGLTAL